MPFERLGEVLDRQIELTHNQIPLKDISKISKPFLDHLPQEMETKFTVLHNCARLGLMLIPAEVHK